MDSSGNLYEGSAARAAIESDKGVIELTEQEYMELKTKSLEERVAAYQKLVDYNENVNTRQVRRARQRYGR